MIRLAERPGVRRAAFLVVLAGLNVFMYAQALDRFFALDQIRYFTELGNDRSLAAGLKFWDYTVSRQYWKGDELLFRPLTHAVLAAENTLFGYDFRAWNLVNLCLHLTVGFVLFELLWFLKPGPQAAGVALLFAALTANFELVVWNHLSGYLLGFSLLLLALGAALRLEADGGPRRRAWEIAYVATMTGASLCHEIAVVAALLMAAYFAYRRKRAQDAAAKPPWPFLLAPVALYAVLYVGHLARSGRLSPGGSSPGALFAGVASSLGLWILKALDPWSADIVVGNIDRFEWAPQEIGGAVLRAGAFLLAVLAFVRRGLTRDQLVQRGPFAALLTLLLLAYAAMVNVGRSYATGVTYYVYFFALTAAVLAYSLVDFDRLSRAARGGVLALLAVAAVAHGAKTHAASARLAAVNRPVADYFTAVEQFVSAHREEPGFAFAVRAPEALDPPGQVWKGYVDHPADGLAPVSALLYPRYYDARILRSGPDPARHRYLLGLK